MLVYENQFSSNCSPLLSVVVRQHITGIVDASPTSLFYCHVITEKPNVNVYLIEHNPLETYTICHFFHVTKLERTIPINVFPPAKSK